MKKISIIIPFFNEEENLEKIFLDLKQKVLINKKYDFEIILMDNASTDNSSKIAKKIQNFHQNIKYYKMSRNFGYQANIKAGYDHCTGDAAIQLDADGEDDPELINKLILKWEEGYDVVYGIRKQREENFILTYFRNIFYYFLNIASEINIPKKAGDFRLIDKKIINRLKKLEEKNLYLRGLISYFGFKQIGIEYDRKKRNSGKSKISIYKYFDIAMSGITSFTKKPLMLILILGFFILLVSFLLIIYYLFLYFFGLIQQPGFTTLVLILLFFFGMIIFLIGVIGVYVGYILEEVKNRPNYILDEETRRKD